MNRILFALVAGVVLAPVAAFAQSQSVNVTGDVQPACVLGTPANATLNIGALTDSSGRLRSELAGTATAAETSIANAWCNTPSTMTLTASPMAMVTTPMGAQQPNFARAVTYTVTLTNWSAPVENRPSGADTAVPVSTDGPQAAAPALGIVFSRLAPLINGAEAPSAFIESGPYSGVVHISLAARS